MSNTLSTNSILPSIDCPPGTIERILMTNIRTILECLAPVPWSYDQVYEWGFIIHRIYFETNHSSFSPELEELFISEITSSLKAIWDDDSFMVSWNSLWLSINDNTEDLRQCSCPYLDIVTLMDNLHREEEFMTFRHQPNVENQELSSISEQIMLDWLVQYRYDIPPSNQQSMSPNQYQNNSTEEWTPDNLADYFDYLVIK